MDPISIIGIVLAIAAILGGGILEHLNPLSLVAPSAALIISGGTIGATITCFSLEEVLKLPKSTKRAFKKPAISLEELIDVFIELATAARREGLLILENTKLRVEHPVLKRGIRLIVDATDPVLAKDMLVTEAAMAEEEAKMQASIYQAAGGFAPTMGIIGTVMGLVVVLGNLANADELGPAIAMAFIATLYGISSANIIFLPLGKKLTFAAKEDMRMCDIIIEGILAIQSGDNPRVIHEKLLSFVNEEDAERMRVKQAAGKH